MEITKTKILSQEQFQQIDNLWNEEYPAKLRGRFSLLLEGVKHFNHYLIQEENKVIAWAVDFYKDNETRFSIIVSKEFQGKGIGLKLLQKLNQDLGEYFGWVIDHNNDIKTNGETYKSPINYYINNGFKILSNQRIDNELISAVKIKKEAKVFVETERLILREIIASDLEGLYALDSDPEVHRYLGNNPVKNKQQIEEVIQFIRQQYIDHGIGRWAIVDKQTHDFMGWTGLKFVTTETNGHKNFYDIGYRLIQKYWRKGYALETAIASLDFAFNQLNIKKINASADCDNIGSNKILQKIGLKLIETFYYDDILCNWYQLDKQEYLKLKL